MSDYRPWERPVPADAGKQAVAQEAAASEAAADQAAAGGAYAPWQRPQQKPAPKPKELEAPPGLGAAPTVRKGARGMRVAAALLLWAGGFWFLAGIAGAAWAGGLATFMEHSPDGQDPDAIRTARSLQTASIVVLLLVGAPTVAAGVAVLYRQAWGKGLGMAAAALQLLAVPFGTLLGIIALAQLARRDAAWWFR